MTRKLLALAAALSCVCTSTAIAWKIPTHMISARRILGFGYLQDQDCYADGTYIETFHPILSSQSRPLVTSSVDGYFERIPEGSAVLLRRTKNALPAMFMYQYALGNVVVTCSYDDWGGFNQSGSGAVGIIRDTIAWATKPASLTTIALRQTAPGLTPGEQRIENSQLGGQV